MLLYCCTERLKTVRRERSVEYTNVQNKTKQKKHIIIVRKRGDNPLFLFLPGSDTPERFINLKRILKKKKKKVYVVH